MIFLIFVVIVFYHYHHYSSLFLYFLNQNSLRTKFEKKYNFKLPQFRLGPKDSLRIKLRNFYSNINMPNRNMNDRLIPTNVFIAGANKYVYPYLRDFFV